MSKLKDKDLIHKPVLLNEVLEALQVKKDAHLKNKSFIDATVGLGGYSEEIVKQGGVVLGIEADQESLKIAQERLEKTFLTRFRKGKHACPDSYLKIGILEENLSASKRLFKLVHANFANIDKVAATNKFCKVHGIVFDLGISSIQFSSDSRGFSFQNKKSPLDMRIDKFTHQITAADLLNLLSETQLTRLFNVVLARPRSRKLAKEVVVARKLKPVKTVGDFVKVIKRIKRQKAKLHPATLPFLSLRLAVNSELENLSEALPKAFELLTVGGRLVTVAFHSAEDRIVKNFFKKMFREKKGEIITKKPVLPKDEEIRANPRARSAKMRVLEKI